MRLFLTYCLLCLGWPLIAQKTVSTDKNWKQPQVFLSNAYEAEYIVRLGDIDNLGFGFPEGYDPFCGRLTDVHSFPWDVPKGDVPGMDRIMVSGKMKDGSPCGADGYSFSAGQFTKGPAQFSLPTKDLKGVVVKDAFLQLFIDDFQAPTFCSEFTITINNKTFLEAQRILNAVNQTGPVGKLVTIPLPIEFYDLITSGMPIRIAIDEQKGAQDGYAVDFIRLLVNRKRENTCKGNISGVVMDKTSNEPVSSAEVVDAEGNRVLTNAEGRFKMINLPTGYEIVVARAKGFADGYAAADVSEGEENTEVIIYLEQGKEALVYNQQALKTGDAITLNNLLFDQGKSDLKQESLNELNNVLLFLNENLQVQIELSGHTSSEGDRALNKSLSYKRVQSCRDYLIGKGVAADRIHIIGYGPDRPVAKNDTEENRKKNRRVEMRIVSN